MWRRGCATRASQAWGGFPECSRLQRFARSWLDRPLPRGLRHERLGGLAAKLKPDLVGFARVSSELRALARPSQAIPDGYSGGGSFAGAKCAATFAVGAPPRSGGSIFHTRRQANVKTIRRFRRVVLRRAREHGESGQAMAEIAIALPLLLLMLIGIWEFARAYQIQQVVVNAAREGAREVVLPTGDEGEGTIATATTVVNNYLAGGSVSGATVQFEPSDEGLHLGGDPITVHVEVPYDFALIGPLIRLATGNSSADGPGDIMLSSQATMRHE